MTSPDHPTASDRAAGGQIEIDAGERLELDDPREADARARYIERHPVAGPMLEGGPHRLYRMRLSWAKLTDNRLGFGVHPVLEFS